MMNSRTNHIQPRARGALAGVGVTGGWCVSPADGRLLTARSATASVVCDMGIRSEDPKVIERPPPEFHFADDVFLRHRAPVPAVRARVPVIPEHEVVTVRHDVGAPVLG